jgi:hypothetical protein
MPDETQTPVPETDTSGAALTADPTGTPAGEDYEARYKELQATFTRTSQEAAQYRQVIESLSDPERAPEALSALGYEVAQPEPTPPQQYDDPYLQEIASLKQVVEPLKEQLATLTQQQQQSQQQSERERYLLEQQAALESDLGNQLDERQLEAVFRLADTMPDEQGRPQVKAAYELLDKLAEQDFERRLQAKRNAPAAPLPGQPGAPSPDLSTREGRLAHAISLVEAQGAA